MAPNHRLPSFFTSNEIKRWISTLGATLLLSGSAAFLNLLAGIIIARNFPTSQVASYGILIALIQWLPLIVALGQPSLTKRMYSLNPPGLFDWVKDLRNGMLWELPTLSLGILVSLILYRLPWGQSLFLTCALLLMCTLQLVVDVLNAHRKYIWANFLLRFPNGLIVLPAVLSLFLPQFVNLDIILLTEAVALLIAWLTGFMLLSRHLDRGSKTIPWKSRWLGITFAILLATNFVPFQGAISIAGLTVSVEAIAALTAFSLLTRPFNLVRELLAQMMTVESARNWQLNHRKAYRIITFGALMISGIAIILFWLITPWLYQHRYDAFLPLLIPLTLSGGLTLSEVVPRSFIAARFHNRYLNIFGYIHAIIAILGLVLMVWSASLQGIFGIAWTATAILAARNLLGLWYYIRGNRNPERFLITRDQTGGDTLLRPSIIH